MNLRKVMFWRQPAVAAAQASPTEASDPPAEAAELGTPAKQHDPVPSATVIPLPGMGTPAGNGEKPDRDEFSRQAPQPHRVKGLMNAPELEAFFKTNQFGFGRHHGSHYRTQEALDRGLQAVVTSFQNIVSELAERRQARVDKLQQSRHEVATLSPTMAETLRLACEQTQREIAVLTEQHALAEQRKGWVLDALNRYQLGFDRGVREALDFDLLNV